MEERVGRAGGRGPRPRGRPAPPADDVRPRDDARARLLHRASRTTRATCRGASAGSRPWTLLDYFPPDWLLVVDESHMTIPQVVGMYKNDRTRKEILVDFGFRLPSALDNRPLTFEEFEATVHQAIYMSATPGPYELERSERIVEQLIRPTGIVDPAISVRPTEGQIDDLLEEIRGRVERGERALVTTLTKKMAEDLTDYLRELGVKVQYLHSEVDTLERVADPARPAPRRLRRPRRDQPPARGDRPARGDPRRDPRRRQGGLPAQRLVAHPDDRPGGPQHRRRGRHVRRHDHRVDAGRDRRDGPPARGPGAYNTAHGIEPTTIVKGIHDINERLRAVAESTERLHARGPAGRADRTSWRPEPASRSRRSSARMEAEMKARGQAARVRAGGGAARRDPADPAAGPRRGRLDDRRPGGRGARRGRRSRPPAGAAGRGDVDARPATARAARTRRRMEVTSVAVLPAAEEPVRRRRTPRRRAGADRHGRPTGCPGSATSTRTTTGWQARWLDRPTWDRTVTPNIRHRTGSAPVAASTPLPVTRRGAVTGPRGGDRLASRSCPAAVPARAASSSG